MTATSDDPPPDGHDRTLLLATARGDRAAFAQLYRRHHARLSRFLLRLTSRRDLIDEVVNDTLWIVWRKAGDFRGESKVSTWITGVAYRCMLKALRDRISKAEINESSLDGVSIEQLAGTGDGADEVGQYELRDWLARGLATLPDDQRVTLELAYFMGESCEDIAAIMDCAVGTVKARMFHARLRLRNVLPAFGGNPTSRDATQVGAP